MRCLVRILIAFAVLVVAATPAWAVNVRVRGGAQIEVAGWDRGTEVIVRGRVTDDVGASFGKVSLQLTARGPGGAIRFGNTRPCEGEDGGDARGEGEACQVTTAESGAFCVRFDPPAAGATLSASFVGNNFYDPAEASATIDAENETRVRSLLKFETTQSVFDLSDERVSLIVSLKVDRADQQRKSSQRTIKREGLALTLQNESGATLSTAPTGGDGKARFTLPARELGAPGEGVLKAIFAGDDGLLPSTTTLPVLRRGAASIRAPESIETSDPEGGFGFDVELTSAHGEVDGGIVEMTIDGQAVGAGPVSGGRAHISASFVGSRKRTLEAELRYSPSAPWWVADNRATVRVEVAGAGFVKQIVFGILLAGITGWIVTKWRRSPQLAEVEPQRESPPSGRPEVLVLERTAGQTGWRGTVTDAHDGHPLEGVRISVLGREFDRMRELASVVTHADGTFALDVAAPPGSVLAAEGEEHARHEQDVPPAGVLRVTLVTRRRALLDRLVKWVRARGAPFEGAKEPTPGHVRRVAARNGSDPVESWAREVEHAAFGPDPVTRAVDERIHGIEPDGQGAKRSGDPDAHAP